MTSVFTYVICLAIKCLLFVSYRLRLLNAALSSLLGIYIQKWESVVIYYYVFAVGQNSLDLEQCVIGYEFYCAVLVISVQKEQW